MGTTDWLLALGLGALSVLALALVTARSPFASGGRWRQGWRREGCWQALWNGTDQWIAILDDLGQIQGVNRPLPTLGAPAEELGHGRMPAPWRQALRKACVVCTQTGASAQVETRWEEGGQLRTFHHRLLPLPSGDSSAAMVLITTETTEQTMLGDHARALEEDLLDAQRRESLGLLAAGLAHDVNNLLGPIMMGAQLCLDEEWSQREKADCLREMLRSVDRAKGMLYELLHCFRQNTRVREPHLLQDTVGDVAHLLRPWAPNKVTIQVEIAEQVAPIIGDQGRLHQLLLNLCMNACQAMKDQPGTLTIRLANRVYDRPERFGGRTLEPGRYVELQVNDTGEGMDARTLSQIFDPLWTKERESGGTGLGLLMVRKIAEAHRAQIKISSCRGVGTEVSVVFPAHTGLAQERDTRRARRLWQMPADE